MVNHMPLPPARFFDILICYYMVNVGDATSRLRYNIYITFMQVLMDRIGQRAVVSHPSPPPFDIAPFSRAELQFLRFLIPWISTSGDMPSAKGAWFDTDIGCLPGIRENVIGGIIQLVNSPDTDTVLRIFLSGVAGYGKSAIFHSQSHDSTDWDDLGRHITSTALTVIPATFLVLSHWTWQILITNGRNLL